MTQLDQEIPQARPMGLTLALAMLAVAVTWAILAQFYSPEAVSALFAGLAFAGVIVTMRLQSDELRLQRAELAQTREELRGQKEQLQAQDRSLRNQTFEGTFFQLLKAFRGAAGHINDGRFGAGSGFWVGFLNMMNQREDYKNATDPLVRVKAYVQHYADSADALDMYFANFQELLAFLERSEFSDNVSYARVIRAQLSAHEKLVIAHHGLTDWGIELRPLVEKLHILRLLPVRFWSYGLHDLEKLYQPTAFLE
jgi:hypothetical protein